LPRLGSGNNPELFHYHHSMPESECSKYKELKERENHAHTAWTSFLYRNEVKPRLSDKAKRKHQKEEMEAYQQAHKARLAHVKTCPICMSNPT
jgi:hypothetical protein